MTNLNELQLFVHIAETGGFTAAATRLGIPKSTVSRGLTRLEERLGIRLMERTTRRVLLTEAGEVYLRHCRQAMAVVDEGEMAISSMRGTPRGRLRVGAPMLFSRLFLTPIIPEFLERYPELQLHLLLGENEGNLLGLNLDLQIQTGRIEDSELLVRPLGSVRYGMYAGPRYVAEHGMPESPDDLPRHECITFKESGPYATWHLCSAGRVAEIRPLPRFSAVDSAILHQLALADVGIAIIPCVLAEPDIASGRLLRLLPDWVPESVDVSAVYPCPLNLAPNARAFLQYLVEQLVLD